MSNETTQSAAPAAGPQPARALRNGGGDQRRAPGFPAGTSGWLFGTSGERRVLYRAWVVVAFVSVLISIVNALTVLDDQPEVDRWEPWVWEGTSAAVIVLILWLPWTAWRLAGRQPRAPRFWLAHAAGLLGFATLHVAGFLVLRHLAYAAMGETYEFGDGWWGEFPYELRKDAISYAVFIATLWIIDRLGAQGTAPEGPATYDIRDGQRVIRTPLEGILGVTSAGNYVEFVLEDGRRPLMRAPLSQVEAELEPKGFVRTHRSWLVNTARVSGLRPDGSGDWTVELGELEAPLSRRFPEALKRLRGA